MSVFRRQPARPAPLPGMPPRPSVLNHRPPDPGLRGAWITQVPLDPEFDPCGAGPLASASSKSGGSS
jgi:hypothetical protein